MVKVNDYQYICELIIKILPSLKNPKIVKNTYIQKLSVPIML